MEAHSKELRREVLAAYAAGETTGPIALRFRVSESWCRRVKQEFREQGKTAPCTTRKRTPKWAAHAERIRELVQQRPDISLSELQAALPTRFGQSTLSNALAALKLSWKNK